MSIFLEAEELNLDKYLVENNRSASDDKLVSLKGLPSGTVGEISTEFNGPEGVYKVEVGYADENDGKAKLDFRVNNVSEDSWVLNQNRGDALPTAKTFTKRTIDNVFLETDDILSILGTSNRAEQARVDYIKLSPVKIQGSYEYTYNYGNGEYYKGYGYTDFDESFAAGQRINQSVANETGKKGYYIINSVDPAPSHGGSPIDWQDYAGDVVVDEYYDLDNNRTADSSTTGGQAGHLHTVQDGSDGQLASPDFYLGTGNAGLGSEKGLTHIDGHSAGFIVGSDSPAYFDNLHHADIITTPPA
jgi:hypothetical protein